MSAPDRIAKRWSIAKRLFGDSTGGPRRDGFPQPGAGRGAQLGCMWGDSSCYLNREFSIGIAAGATVDRCCTNALSMGSRPPSIVKKI